MLGANVRVVVRDGSIVFFDDVTLEWILSIPVTDAYNVYGAHNWTDVRVAGSQTKSGSGLKAPGYDKFRDNGAGSDGVYSYAFDKASEEEVLFEVQVPHGLKPGTELRPHVHWSPGASTNTGKVRWGLEYTIANVYDVMPVTKIIYADDVGSGVAYKHQLAAFAPITGSWTESLMMECRLFRNATDATNDTFDADAFLLEFDLHYDQDKLGTYDEYPT